jgi:hypothetical protein
LEIPTYNAGVNDGSAGFVGWTNCLSLLNRAYTLLANWKTPQGRIVRFREHNKTFLWQNIDASTTLTATAVDATGKIITFAGAAFVPNLYSMWYININGFASMIISNTADTITVKDATTLAAVNGFAGTLYKRWFPVTENATDVTNLGYPAGQYIPAANDQKIIAFQRIVNLTLNNQEIVPADRTQLFWDLPSARTHPMIYRFTELGLEFDMAPVNNDLLRLMYYGEPEVLTTDLQVPVIPSAWHEILWNIAAWLRKNQDQNTEEATMDERRINGMINQRVQEFERENAEINVGVFVRD